MPTASSSFWHVVFSFDEIKMHRRKTGVAVVSKEVTTEKLEIIIGSNIRHFSELLLVSYVPRLFEFVVSVLEVLRTHMGLEVVVRHWIFQLSPFLGRHLIQF